MSKQIYYIKGLHCASCELLIEQKLLEMDGVRFADTSIATGQLDVEYDKEKPKVEILNDFFRDRGYTFSEQPFPKVGGVWKSMPTPIIVALIVITIFFIISKLGLGALVNINSNSSLVALFIFGLLAGMSSCAALIGGLVLSLSKQWLKDSEADNSFLKKSTPHLLFNIGRIISYGLLGTLLGLVGEKLKISPFITSVLVVLVSGLMLVLALQMLGVRALNRFRFALPKSATSRIAERKNRTRRLAPLAIGFLTFLLPCGFTLAAEGAAVLSASAWHGMGIMLAFVLGTTIPLLMIGLFSAKLIADSKFSANFLRVAGILIIFFVLYNLNFQFNLTRHLASSAASVPASVINSVADQNVQTINAVYTQANDIIPNNFEVKKGETVVFGVEVKDDGTGCMGTIMIPGLWDRPQILIKGQTVVMRFTPLLTGTYQITCAMGVPRGTIKVID